MNQIATQTPAYEEESKPALDFFDILFMLYRHKWKIALFSFLGLAASAGLLFFGPTIYRSEAKLLVRYVLERNAVDEQGDRIENPGGKDLAVMKAETEILMSRDLAVDVAESIVQRSAKDADPPTDVDALASQINAGLLAEVQKGSTIIHLSLRAADPVFASRVLDEYIKRYLDKHIAGVGNQRVQRVKGRGLPGIRGRTFRGTPDRTIRSSRSIAMSGSGFHAVMESRVILITHGCISKRPCEPKETRREEDRDTHPHGLDRQQQACQLDHLHPIGYRHRSVAPPFKSTVY